MFSGKPIFLDQLFAAAMTPTTPTERQRQAIEEASKIMYEGNIDFISLLGPTQTPQPASIAIAEQQLKSGRGVAIVGLVPTVAVQLKNTFQAAIRRPEPVSESESEQILPEPQPKPLPCYFDRDTQELDRDYRQQTHLPELHEEPLHRRQVGQVYLRLGPRTQPLLLVQV